VSSRAREADVQLRQVAVATNLGSSSAAESTALRQLSRGERPFEAPRPTGSNRCKAIVQESPGASGWGSCAAMKSKWPTS